MGARADTPGHVAAIAAIDAGTRAALQERADAPALAGLALWVALAAPLAVLAAGQGWLAWAARLPLGVMIVFLFTLHHEAIHLTAFRSPRANRAVARVIGLLIFLPTWWFTAFHMAHHRHTQDPANDPELETPKPETLAQYAWHLTGLPTWAGQLRVLLANATGRIGAAYVPVRARARMMREAQAMLAVYAAVLIVSAGAESWLAVRVWILPILLGQPFLRAYLLAEHGRCPFVADMLANTRTTFTNALVRWLAWNMPYHAEHHAMPTVPFHRLPDLHALLCDRLKVTQEGYARFNVDYARAAARGELRQADSGPE